MKKLLITLLNILLVAFAFIVVLKGLDIGKYRINSYKDIKRINEQLDSKIVEASKLTSIDFPEKIKSLSNAGKQLSTAKQQYEDKITYSSEEEVKLATQVKTYKLEFLYTKLGNYRLKEGVGMELIFEKKSIGWDIHFVITGKYLSIAEFIRDIEDDDDLNFRIDGFKLVPGTSTENLKAEFYVRTIELTEVDQSITNATVSTDTENAETTNRQNKTTDDTEAK